MSVEDNWLAHLKELVRREGGGRDGYRAVANKSGLSEEYVYQLCNAKPHADGSPKNPGKSAARRLAKAYANGRSIEWIDQPLGASSPGLTAREPSPWTVDTILGQLGILLAQTPPTQRGMVAMLMAEWAREGGADHYLAPLAAALRGVPSKPLKKSA